MPNGMAMPGRHGMPRRLACGCYAPSAGILAAMAVTEASSGSVASPVNVEAEARTRSKSAGEGAGGLVIDCHGHYTTEPKALFDWRKRQIDAIGSLSQAPRIGSCNSWTFNIAPFARPIFWTFSVLIQPARR